MFKKVTSVHELILTHGTINFNLAEWCFAVRLVYIFTRRWILQYP